MSVVERSPRPSSSVSPSSAAARSQPPARMALPQPEERVAPIPLVKLCYTMVHAAEAVGIRDLADGEYAAGDTTLEQGIERQLNYLLDEVGCTRPGFRLLEIGCGYGHLLKLAKDRGARAVGVNTSREQVDYCNQNGLQAYCTTYRNLLKAKAWHGQFDGVIANGSLEHWVQPEDVQAGRMNPIYHESFEIANKCLDPGLATARYVTTAIHVKREVKPEYLLTPWQQHPQGSDRRHFALLHGWMGGYYPVDGQLAECAKPFFTLEKEVDGTLGYKIANDYRMKRMMRGWYTSPKMVGRIARVFMHSPREARTMMQCYFIEKTWDWQFRGDDPPMKLLRHTWRAVEA
jgi:cyclopropane fatty-acyl-phospholipid synthase-like methyltransferase